MGGARQPFVQCFLQGEVAGALRAASGEDTEGWLSEAVLENGGRCHREAQVAIAEALTTGEVLGFRDAVGVGDVGEVRRRLDRDPGLLGAIFPTGRGLGQAVHHWRDVAVGALLLERGVDVGAQNSLGETALHHFAARGVGREVIGALLAAGADVGVRDEEGRTASDLARVARRREAERILVGSDGCY